MEQTDKETTDYGMFKTHLDNHTQLGQLIEEELQDYDGELKSSELAKRIATEAGHTPGHTHALITQGREWIEENHEVVTEQRPEQSGGKPTIFWRHG